MAYIYTDFSFGIWLVSDSHGSPSKMLYVLFTASLIWSNELVFDYQVNSVEKLISFLNKWEF